MAFSPFPTGLQLQAATPVAGAALINGTQTFLTWTPPNDGLLHRALVVATLDVTTTEVGGTIQMKIFDPAGNTLFQQLFAAAQGVGVKAAILGAAIQAGQPITVIQSSALTSGAATMWAEIWGS